MQVDTNDSGLIEWKEFLALVSRMDSAISDALAPDDPNDIKTATDFDFITEVVEVNKSFRQGNFFLSSNPDAKEKSEEKPNEKTEVQPRSKRQSKKEALAKNPMQAAADNLKEKNPKEALHALVNLEACLRVDHVWASDDSAVTRIPWEAPVSDILLSY